MAAVGYRTATCGPSGAVSPKESPHELHIVSIPPAIKIPVMDGTETAARVAVPGEENCNAMLAGQAGRDSGIAEG
jgi:hypothetical protein